MKIHQRLLIIVGVVPLLLCSSAFALDRQPNADYHARRVALAQKLNGGVAVIFAATEAEGPNATFGFRQDDNFFYLSGLREPGAALLIAPAFSKDPAQQYTEILFLPGRNLTQEKWTGPKLGADDPQATAITGFNRVANLDTLSAELAKLLAVGRPALYLDMPESGEQNAASNFLDWSRRANTLPLRTGVNDVKPALAQLRVIKDAGEIERIRHATDASIAAHLAALQMIKPGLNEHDVEARMQYEFMKGGCERPAYAPIVGSGFNSTVLHYSADDAPIRDGDVVVMDVAGEYAMYASDITRTAPANGKFTDRQREIYNVVLGAQQAAMKAFKSGQYSLTGINSLYKVAYDYINTHGKDLHGQPLGQYFIHGLGHYVGLEVHDVGDTTAKLGPGMVFTIEPGIYIPEEKIGVRIEDIYYFDAQGNLIDLTASLPHTAEEVEAAMAGTYKPKS
ncbi:MAG: aminopeptidase P N-terminal domain-containing protein [Candidatus Korobacteraceae bacterium]